MDGINRRDVLRGTAAGLAACPLIGGAYAALRFAAVPAPTRRPQRVPLCRLEEVPAEGFAVRSVTYDVQRGPVTETVGSVVFVRREGDDVLALSGRCPHLGCTVTANSDSEGPPILCPCHDASFDAEGKVLSGPPKEGLAALTVSVPEDPTEMIYLEL